MTLVFPALVVEEGTWPIEVHDDMEVDVIMAHRFGSWFVNPKLREVEQEIAAAAYVLRQDTKVGSPEYKKCSDIIAGHLSLPALALLAYLDERSGRGILAAAFERTTGQRRPASSSLPSVKS